jgi:hypothetical protein
LERDLIALGETGISPRIFRLYIPPPGGYPKPFPVVDIHHVNCVLSKVERLELSYYLPKTRYARRSKNPRFEEELKKRRFEERFKRGHFEEMFLGAHAAADLTIKSVFEPGSCFKFNFQCPQAIPVVPPFLRKLGIHNIALCTEVLEYLVSTLEESLKHLILDFCSLEDNWHDALDILRRLHGLKKVNMDDLWVLGPQGMDALLRSPLLPRVGRRPYQDYTTLEDYVLRKTDHNPILREWPVEE